MQPRDLPVFTAPTVAVIGSFRQHYETVLDVRAVLERHGVQVTTPAGAPILQEGIEFVRFESDDGAADDYLVQSRTLELILASTAVYVVAPDGYVGRTTCYEIGRVRQAKVPLFFSESPRDLPMRVPASRVLSPKALAITVAAGGLAPWDYPASYADSVVEHRLTWTEGG